MSGHQNDKVAQTINTIINRATDRQASSIHIEPRQKVSVIRIRSHGRLYDIAKLPAEHHAAVIAQLRKRADESSHFLHASDGKQATVRLHTMPLLDGEKAVLHVAYRNAVPPTLEQRDYWGQNLMTIEHALSEPHGVVQVASLDQTAAHHTLLALAQLLHDTQHNIVTISDTTSHAIEGINQILSPQHQQAERLRFALQQDSDVIILGTITDRAAAELTYEVGLGRHLLIGSVYAADGAQALRRTIDMGIAEHLIASSLKLVIAEKQVSRLCQNCRVAYAPTKTQLQKVTRLLGKTDFTNKAHTLENQARQAGIGSDIQGLSTSAQTIGRLWKTSPVGCEACHFTGYTGFININEVIPVHGAIQRAIITNQSADAIRELHAAHGAITMGWDGFVKALRGLVSLEEIFGKQYR